MSPEAEEFLLLLADSSEERMGILLHAAWIALHSEFNRQDCREDGLAAAQEAHELRAAAMAWREDVFRQALATFPIKERSQIGRDRLLRRAIQILPRTDPRRDELTSDSARKFLKKTRRPL